MEIGNSRVLMDPSIPVFANSEERREYVAGPKGLYDGFISGAEVRNLSYGLRENLYPTSSYRID